MESERTTEKLTWALHLQKYLEKNSLNDPASSDERRKLVDHIQASPCSAEAWAQFLMHEEAATTSKNFNRTAKPNPGLRTLFRCAAEQVPVELGQASEASIYLWIGHARHIWYRHQDEARDIFKAIKNKQYRNNRALVYHEWALLEHEAGNIGKALSVLDKGIRDGAEPRRMLESLMARWQPDSGLGTSCGGGNRIEPMTTLQERRVHFQDASAAAFAGTSLTDGAASFRRAIPSTPGVQIKLHDPSASLLPGDLMLGFSAQPHTGCVPSKSHTPYQSHSYDYDTINGRSGEDSRTQGSLGASLDTSRRTGGSSYTGTVPMTSGISATLNLAAGAAAVAALSGSAFKGNTSSLNTGNVGFGLRRFGFTSKAVRITNEEKTPAVQTDGVSSSLTSGTACPAMPLAVSVAALGNSNSAGALSSHQLSGHYQVAQLGNDVSDGIGADGARTRGGLVAPQPAVSSETQASEDFEELRSRKRRAATDAALSSARFVASVVLQEEGLKRRQSPDLVPLASALSSAGTGALQSLSDFLGANPGSSSFRNADKAQTALPDTARYNPANSPAASSERASLLVTGSCPAATSAAAPMGQSRSSRQAAGTWQIPQPTPCRDAAHRDTTMDKCPAAHAAIGASDPMQVDRQVMNGAVGAVRAAGGPVPSCADENMFPPGPSSAPPSVADENQAPVSDGAKVVVRPLSAVTAAAPQSQSSSSHQPQPPDSREPLRPVGYAASRAAKLPPASASVQLQQHPTTPVVQPQQQQAGDGWPERLEHRQVQPLETETYVYVHGVRYQKLDLAGRGGSSRVYKVLGLNRGIYALKRVRFQNKDNEAVKGFIDEITLLKQLRGKPNIIQLMDSQVFYSQGLNGVGYVYMVLEYGDIDLAKLLSSHEEARRRASSAQCAAETGDDGPCDLSGSNADGSTYQEIDANFIRLYWQQMLRAVKCIHDARIVHADLKPANFMLVQGQLKLIDFGIAKAIQGDTTSINRESQMGTLNYMSPEAIQSGSSNPLGGPALKVGRTSDVWSLGCILYQMIYGRTPFADLPLMPKMNAICNSDYQVPMPDCGEPDAVDCIHRCLDRNPRTRISLQELLDHPFLHPNRRKHHQPLVVESPAPAPSATAVWMGCLTEEQIKAILQVGQGHMLQLGVGGGGSADLDSIARQVRLQLSGGDCAATAVGSMNATATAAARQPLAQLSTGVAPLLPHMSASKAPPLPPQEQQQPPQPPSLQQAAPRALKAQPPPPPPPPPPPGPPPAVAGLALAAARAAWERRAAQSLPEASAPALRSKVASVGGMGDIADMVAAAAVKRANKPVEYPHERGKSTELPRTGTALAGSNGARPLAGAELQAAITQQRAQLRPLQEQHCGLGLGCTTGGGMSQSAHPSSARSQPTPNSDRDDGLEAVLRRGLERFHFDDGDTDGNTDFMEAAMTAAQRQG